MHFFTEMTPNELWKIVLNILTEDSRVQYTKRVDGYLKWCEIKEFQPINAETILKYLIEMYETKTYCGK